MSKVDFSLLRTEIKEAARRAFEEVRASHPGEHFYAFALYSDDSAMTVVPAANSEEALLRTAQDSGESLTSSWLRWGTAEWNYESEGDEHFTATYDMINVEGNYDESEPQAFEIFRNRVFETMIEALGELDATGFFGTGEAREAVTLFCSISDSDDAEQLENESAKLLNSATVYEKFIARLDE